MEQYEYYQQQQLHPDQGNLASQESAQFRDYLRIRHNLYQRLLHLPLSLLSDKQVLEVGCGTGESSLVLALHGAHVKMVDADATVIDPQNALFERFGVNETQYGSENATLDEYQDKTVYDLVTAEGWLFTLRNRALAIRKLCGFVKDGGFLIVSYPDRFGSFLEYIRKAALWRAYQLAGIDDIHSDRGLEIARVLLGPGYISLPSPRPFEVWWKDCMVSPFLRWQDTWTCSEILSEVRQCRMSFYSSSPRIFELPHLAWYKGLPHKEEEEAQIREGYKKRKYDMLIGGSAEIELSNEEMKQLDNAITDILKNFSIYFQSLDKPVPDCNFPRSIGLTVTGQSGGLLDEISQFFDLLRSNESFEGYIRRFEKLQVLGGTWGSSYCFLCLQKESMLVPNV